MAIHWQKEWTRQDKTDKLSKQPLQSRLESKPKMQSWAAVKEMKDLWQFWGGSFNLSSRDVSLLYHADCTPLLWRECQLHPVSYLSQAPVSIDSMWAGVISQSEAPGESMPLCHTREWDCVIQERERAKRKCAYVAEPEANCPDLDTQQLGYLYCFRTLMLVLQCFACFCGFFWGQECVEFCMFCCFHKNIKFKFNRQ